MTTAKISVSKGGRSDVGVEHSLFLNRNEYVKLGGADRLELSIRMRYQIVKIDNLDPGPYKISTLAYDYSLQSGSGEAVLDVHWHPTGQSHETKPHMHIGSSQLSPNAVLSNKAHLPTGRISVEEVIRMAIGVGAEPRFDDWDARLLAAEGPFKLHRSWN